MNEQQGKATKSQTDRLEEASQNLEKILKKIEPYAKPMEVEGYSTAGKWQVASGANPHPALK